jgi:hypothetical protein
MRNILQEMWGQQYCPSVEAEFTNRVQQPGNVENDEMDFLWDKKVTKF